MDNKDEVWIDLTEGSLEMPWRVKILWKDEWRSLDYKEFKEIIKIGLRAREMARHLVDGGPLKNFPSGLKLKS